METSINSFSEGMVTDLDKSLKSTNSYQYASNLRYLANINDNTGTLHSIESSKDVYGVFAFTDDEYIIGHRIIRNYLVLFSSSYTAGVRRDYIKRFTIGDTSLTSMSIIYNPTSDTNMFGATGSALPEFLTTAGVYEDADNIKVYWGNSNSPLRSINITEVYTGDPNRLNSIPLFSTKTPIVNSIVSGKLTSGRVQYAFSLYKEKGQESVISGLTNPIDIFSDSLNAPSTALIKGDFDVKNTGKGVKVDILSIDSSDINYFDKLRLYRVYYSEYGQLPTVTIVNDFTLPLSGDLSITDTGGTGLGSITAEEFAVISGVQYAPYTIEEKDNILFLGNVKEEVFEITDFDTRAYRFTSSSNPSYIRTAHLFPEYGAYTSGDREYTLVGPTPTYSAVADSANCINAHNDINNDTVVNTYDYVYQADGSTLGGEGENIEYSFTTESSVQIDGNSTSFYQGETYNGSGDYTDPTQTVSFTGYQRGEIYRFGIVFKNEYGISSSVKWIGDIRFPMYSNRQTITEESSVIVRANTIGITFTLKDTPSEATSWEIVRVKREKQDRSIITSGYGSISYDDDQSYNTTCKYPWPITRGTKLPDTPTGVDNYRIMAFVSPEESYQQFSDIKVGDFFHVVGSLSAYETYGSYATVVSTVLNKQSIKYKDNILFYSLADASSKVLRYTVEEAEYIGTNNTPIQEYSYSQALNGIYRGYIQYRSPFYDLVQQKHGRSSVLQLSANFPTSTFTAFSSGDYDIPYIYITRDNPGRYGGYSLEDKEINKYISCGKTVLITDLTETVYGGDTFINYFDYLTTVYNQEDHLGAPITEDHRESISVIFPVESAINSSLRYDIHFAKDYTNANVALMQEYSGTYIHTGSAKLTYIQPTDLYLNNSVYAQENNININFSTETVDLEKDLDTRVVYSNKKIYDESIDSWSKFSPLNFIDVESRYGAVKSLSKFNNNLYYIQDKAIGILSVNQRSLFTDNNPGALSLGTGGILDRFDYISEFYGTQHKKSITVNKGGIYFFDKNNKSIIAFNGKQIELLNESKGIKTYINNLTLLDIPFVENSSKNSEVYFQLSSNTLVYNNFTGTIISDYTFNPDYIADIDKFTIYTSKVLSMGRIYGLYLGSTYGSFDEGDTYVDSTLKIINNDNFYNTKTYDNVIFFTSSKLAGIERNTDSFDEVEFYNDYQYTGSIGLTIGSNLQIRERGYALVIPRNIVNVNGTTNIDIFNVVNQDSTRAFKERMRDKYITAEFTYENSATKGQLSVPYISFLYRQSKR